MKKTYKDSLTVYLEWFKVNTKKLTRTSLDYFKVSLPYL
jgi:hypothetical protein